MKVPRKVVFRGNFDRCNSVLGEAEKMLNVFQERLTRGSLAQGWSNNNQLRTGEVVDMAVSFGLQTIVITAPDGVPEKVGLEVDVCPCNCNFSLGKILAFGNQEEIDDGQHAFPIYDVEICQKNASYLKFINILSTDHTPWAVGQKVLVIPYRDFWYDCCGSGRSRCTTQDRATSGPQLSSRYLCEFQHTANIIPLFRIIPVCAINIPYYSRIIK